MKGPGRPLIITVATEHLPRWVRVRDVVLTVLLWLGCGWMWLEIFPEVRGWLTARTREDLTYELPSIVALLKSGLVMTGALLVLYFFWSVRTFLGANRDTALPAPPHLPPEEEARAYGVKPAEVTAMRTHASLTVLAGKDGRVVSWQPGFTPKKPG